MSGELIERLRRATEAHLDLGQLDARCEKIDEIRPPSEEWCREVNAGCQCTYRKGHRTDSYAGYKEHRCRECRRAWP